MIPSQELLSKHRLSWQPDQWDHTSISHLQKHQINVAFVDHGEPSQTPLHLRSVSNNARLFTNLSESTKVWEWKVVLSLHSSLNTTRKEMVSIWLNLNRSSSSFLLKSITRIRYNGILWPNCRKRDYLCKMWELTEPSISIVTQDQPKSLRKASRQNSFTFWRMFSSLRRHGIETTSLRTLRATPVALLCSMTWSTSTKLIRSLLLVGI